MKKLILSMTVAAVAVACTNAQTLVFDNISNARNAVPGAVLTSTSSTPNTFMGSAYNLFPGTTAITGFDLFPVNLSGTSFNALRINIYVWGGVNLGTVNATTPAFSNLLGQYTLSTTGTFNTGFYFPFENAIPGSAPGISLGTPLALSSNQIGITVNYQGSTDGGTTYANVNSLTSPITYGTPATVGSNVFNGYYRNAATETNGNFTSTLRSLGQTNQSVGMRIYGSVVPEPATMAAIGIGIAGLASKRRRK